MNQNFDNDTKLAEFVSLLTTHQAVLRGYIRTLIPNISDVSDVLQNTNVMLWERRDTFEPGSNFKAWAFAVARYRVMEACRKFQRESRLVFVPELIQMLDGDCHERSVGFVEMEYLALEHCLGMLNDRDRALIDARYNTRTLLAEHARADGRSEASLRVILNRLRTMLRDCINNRIAMEGGRA